MSFKVPWEEFLRMSAGLDVHRLHTLDVSAGEVHVTSRLAMEDLCSWANDGVLPERALRNGEVRPKKEKPKGDGSAVKEALMKNLSIIENLVDDGDFYRGRCPSCAEGGRDRSGVDFWLKKETLAFGCHNSCESAELFASVAKKLGIEKSDTSQEEQKVKPPRVDVIEEPVSEETPWKVATAFICQEGSGDFLMVDSGKGWMEVGGKRDDGESSPLETLAREVMEEVGLDITTMSITHHQYYERTRSHVFVLKTHSDLLAVQPMGEIQRVKVCNKRQMWDDSPHFRARIHSTVFRSPGTGGWSFSNGEDLSAPGVRVVKNSDHQTVEHVLLESPDPRLYLYKRLSTSKATGREEYEEQVVEVKDVKALWNAIVSHVAFTNKSVLGGSFLTSELWEAMGIDRTKQSEKYRRWNHPANILMLLGVIEKQGAKGFIVRRAL